MATIFYDTPTYHGIMGDRARVMHIEGRVLIRAVDGTALEAVTIAMSPDQARDFARAVLGAADMATGGGK